MPRSTQSRPVPDDFEIVFIERGRLECESYFRARRTTITRWLTESGKAKLLRRRAEFVRAQRRMNGKGGKAKTGSGSASYSDKTCPKLAEMAARHLQSPSGGGWVIYPHDEGGFVIGTMRKTAGEIVKMAQKKGFDRRRAQQQIKAFSEPN